MGRISPIIYDNLSPEQQRVYDRVAEKRGGVVSGPFLVWIRRPELCEAIQKVSDIVRFGSRLTPTAFELMTLVVARGFNAPYMWGVHASAALKAGLPQKVIDDINQGRRPYFENSFDQMVFDAADAMMAQDVLPQDVFERALSTLGLDTLTEVATDVGFYAMSAVVLNAFDIQAADGATALGPAIPRRTGGAVDHTVPRFPPIVYEELTPEQRVVYKRIAGPRDGVVSGPFIVRIRLPELCEKIQGISDILRTNSNLKRYMFELITLVISKRYNAQYMWGVHSKAAIKAGLSPTIVEDISCGRRPVLDNPADQIIFDVADILVRQQTLPQNVYDRALELLGVDLLLEVATDVGYYAIGATTINTYDIQSQAGTMPPLG